MKVTRKCQHVTEFDDTGMPAFKRDKQRKFLSETACVECDPKARKKREDQKRQYRDQENKKALAEEQRLGFDPLEGSEKQIEWARRIRLHLVAQAYEACGLDESQFEEVVAQPANQLTDASWWIDHREMDASTLPSALALALSVPVESGGSENPFK